MAIVEKHPTRRVSLIMPDTGCDSDARRRSGLVGCLVVGACTAYDGISRGNFAGISIKQKPIAFQFYKIDAGPIAVEYF